MDLDKAVRAAVAREIAPLLADCEQMRAQLDRTFPILLDKRERDAIFTRRAKLECLLTELRGVEDRVVRLARERWPQWRT
jgi:hypothetical protein